MLVLPRPVVRTALTEATTSDLLPTDVGYFPAAAGHDVRRPEGTSQIVLIHCPSGEGWAEVNGKEFAVGPGDVLVLPPDRAHAYGAVQDNAWTIYWIHVAGRKVNAIHRMLSEDGSSPLFHTGEDAEALGLFDETFEILHRSYGPDDLLLASLTTGRLLGRFITLRRRPPASASTADLIARTIEVMRRRLSSPVSVPELAHLANLSSSHFAAEFKRQTGYAVLDYFIRLRIQRAAHLLDTTALPIKVIAAELGYEDPLYFSRQFRRVHDLSPAQYRAIKKG